MANKGEILKFFMAPCRRRGGERGKVLKKVGKKIFFCYDRRYGLKRCNDGLTKRPFVFIRGGYRRSIKAVKALFIVNPLARGKDRTDSIYSAVGKVFGGEEGFFRVKRSEAPGHAKALAEEALARGFECVVACGGDATVNEVAGVLVGSPVVLGLVPLGRANSLARGLKIPDDPVAALTLVREWRIRAVDAGVFCGKYFFGSAGFGLDAGFAKKYKKLFFASRPGEFFTRHPGALREFSRHKAEELSIKVDNALIRISSLSLTASNVENYCGPALMAPGADPADGLIELSIMPGMGPLSASSVSRKLFSGRIASLKGFRRIKGHNIEIARDHATEVHVDGEPFEWIGNIKISSVQRGLKVAAPAGDAASAPAQGMAN